MTHALPIALYWDGKNSRASVIQENTFYQSKLHREWLAASQMSLGAVIGQLARELDKQTNKRLRHAVAITNREEPNSWYAHAAVEAESCGIRIVDQVRASVACCIYQLRNDSDAREILVCNFASQGLFVELLSRSESGFDVVHSDENREFADIQRQAIARVVRRVLDPQQFETADKDSLEKLYDDLMQPQSDASEGYQVGNSPFWAKLSGIQRDQILQDAFERVPDFVLSAIHQFGRKPDKIDRVCVAGGIARYKSLRGHLSRLTKHNRNLIIDKPTHAVVLGGAKIAREMNLRLLTQTTDALHVTIIDSNDSDNVAQHTVIPRLSALPATATMVAQTGSRLQDRILLQLDRSPSGGTRERLANIRLGPIKYLRRGYTFEIEFRYDQSGMIEVLARDKVTGEETVYFVDGLRKGPPLSI